MTSTPLAPTGIGTAPARTAPTPSFGPKQPSCADRMLDRLSEDERVGQLLMVGTPIDEVDSMGSVIRQYHLGGVFLAGRSGRSAAGLRRDIAALAGPAGDVPVHVAVDQEGGRVQSLRGGDFPTFPAAVEQGGWDPTTLETRTTDWARRLVASGVTMNLGPVADTVPAELGRGNPPIGAFGRQFGAEPGAVADDIVVVVDSTQAAGLLATLKHFPGLGRVLVNTDTSAGAIDPDTSERDPHLRPFAAGIGANAGAVMMSSASYPALDPQNIAAFSHPIVTGLLRGRLGFTGVVVSDDLGNAVAVRDVAVGTRAVRFVQAGGDLVLTVRRSDAAPMYDALRSASRTSAAFRERVADAARRILESKVRVGLLRCR
ncbi:glycoside hydrolase family 3 N-terminal domain-containing protein [Longispora sp. NPDC051575]|uniref:glycoside hydrolase family 3 N-terminal domain-containing protein n=1 Tax=Longispora sp. NPDC051575 TaxID=3154943 RepID=UPI0034228575